MPAVRLQFSLSFSSIPIISISVSSGLFCLVCVAFV